jgi:hypothetical protein
MKIILSCAFTCLMLYGENKSKPTGSDALALKQSGLKAAGTTALLHLNDGLKSLRSQSQYKLLQTGVEKASKVDGTLVVKKNSSPFESQPLLAVVSR